MASPCECIVLVRAAEQKCLQTSDVPRNCCSARDFRGKGIQRPFLNMLLQDFAVMFWSEINEICFSFDSCWRTNSLDIQMPLEVDPFSFSEGNVLLVLNFFLCTSVKFHFKPKWPL